MSRWDQSIRVKIEKMLYRNVGHSGTRRANGAVTGDHFGYTLFECTMLDAPDQTVFVEFQKDNYHLREGRFVEFAQGKWDDTRPDKFLCKKYEPIRSRQIPANTRYALEKLHLPGLTKKVVVDRVVQTFGLDAPQRLWDADALENDIGLQARNAATSAGRWADMCDFASGAQKLRDIAVPAFACYAVWIHGLEQHDPAAYVDKILENPYLLQDEMRVMKFKDIDTKVRPILGIEKTDPRRIASLILSLFYETPHTFLYEDDILNSGIVRKYDVPLEKLRVSMADLIGRKEIIEETDTQNDGETQTLYSLRELNEAEIFIAKKLMAMKHSDYAVLTPCIQQLRDRGFQIDQQQEDAIRAAAGSPVVIVTGGAGTGKTHTVKAILEMFGMNHLQKIAVAAPTGRAAHRLEEKTGWSTCCTIHRLLDWDYIKNTCKRNEDNQLDYEAVIIDETSMVDTEMMMRLLKAVPETTRLIFVGDRHQLQPVKQGAPFKEMCLSGHLPLIELTTIHRQGEGSAIIHLADDILHRQISSDLSKYPAECELHNIQTESEMVDLVTSTIRRLINTGISADDIMVLCKTHGKNSSEKKVTTKHLNMVLQNMLNPDGEGLFTTRDGIQIRKGDRVMALRNHPNEGVFNGYIGHVAGFNPLTTEMIDVNFEEDHASYSYNRKDVGKEDGELDLAYTMTVHKSQGSEYRIVIFAFGANRGYENFLDRLMLYTAVTRAREKIILIGRREVLEEAAENKNVRHDRLRKYLQELDQTWTEKREGGVDHV